ncbi:sensor histidine kinase [Embleya sp. AB8]|uniref:sensor histidine kinase n=1 Tax=Embleya sp. AB8 TaxID=3156304 RepID=UPI003C70B2E9
MAGIVLTMSPFLDWLAGDGVWPAVGSSLLGVLVLLLRLRFPASVAAVAPLLLYWPAVGLPVTVCAAWSAGRRVVGLGRTTLAFGGALVAMVGLPQVLGSLFHEGDLTPPLGYIVVVLCVIAFVVFVGVPGLAGRYHAQSRALSGALYERAARLTRERDLIARETRHRERTRIAQDMHDSLGHRLVLISVHAAGLGADPTLTDGQRTAAEVLRQASTEAMRELREVVGILREDEGEDAPDAAGSVAGIADLVAASTAGIDVVLERSGRERPLAPAAEHTAYRVVQEGLTNILKHAPGASARVSLRYEPDHLAIEVRNGPAPTPDAGADAISGGRGLVGLGERARMVGGRADSGPTTDGGFRLTLALPYLEPGAESGAIPRARAARAQGKATTSLADDPSGEAAEVLAAARAKRRFGIGLLVAAPVFVVAGAALLAWGTVTLLRELDRGQLRPETYDAVEVGRAEEDVRSLLPEGSELMTRNARSQAPPEPPKATCSYFVSNGPTAAGSPSETAFRFCFVDGHLVEKRTFPVTPE